MDDYPADRHGVILPLKICVGVTSVLSIIGGFLIVLTFCLRDMGLCFKSNRQHSTVPAAAATRSRSRRPNTELISPGRVILVNLSIADMLVSGSHLWGVAAGYDSDFSHNDTMNTSGPIGSSNTMCSVQGGVAVYFTIASFLWTIILSFFVVGTLLLPHPRRYGSPCALLVYLVMCWGLPAVVIIVVALKNEFGLEDKDAIGKCIFLHCSKPCMYMYI